MSSRENIRIRRFPEALSYCVYGVFYYLAALFFLYLQSQPDAITSAWLPNGIAVAVMVRSKKSRRVFIGLVICVCGLAANLTFGYGAKDSIWLAAANICEIVTAVSLILFFNRENKFLDGVGGLIRDILPAVALAPLAGCLAGAIGMGLYPQQYHDYWLRWYAVHALGIFTMLPFGLAMTWERCRELWTKRVAIRLGGMLIVAALISLLARAHFFPPVLFVNLALVIAALILPLVGSLIIDIIMILTMDVLTSIGFILPAFVFRPGFDPARYLGIVLILIPAVLVSILMEAIRQDRLRLMEATKRAKLSEDAKSMFLAAMSHEIRSPLNSIIGFANLLWDSGPTEKNRELIRPILTGGEILLSLINDVLDYTKIEAGRIDLEQVTFSPAAYIRQIEELYKQKALEKKLTFAVSIDPATPAFLTGDASRIRQVLINLVANAEKFTSQGGIEISLTAMKEDDGNYHLHFRVVDTGIGIPAEKFGQIFERFEQIDSSTARQFGGTGLGLAISRSLTEAMDGKLWVESEVGKGSTFHMEISLPEAESGVTEETVEPVPAKEDKFQIPRVSEAVRNLRLLVVDDNASNRKLVVLLLNRMGCQKVVVARDGRAAIDALREESFDVILMDCQMPIMDGFEATRQIRQMEQARGRRMGVIALTAAVLVEDRRKAAESGMDDFVMKPIRQHTLAFALERANERLEKKK